MYRVLLLLLLSLPQISFAQDYELNTRATSVQHVYEGRWLQPLSQATLQPGMRFILLPPQNFSKDRDLEMRNAKHLWINKLRHRDFSGQIFTFVKKEPARKGYDDIIEYTFSNGDKQYVVPGDVPKNENERLQWEESALVWLDEIDSVRQWIRGKEVWLTADDWQYENENGGVMTEENQQRFVPVKILDIGLGQYSNQPCRLLFQPKGSSRKYFTDVFISGSLSTFLSRNIADMVSVRSPESNYPNIKSAWWPLIEKGDVKPGMTVEACILALGQPEGREEYEQKSAHFISLSFPKSLTRAKGFVLLFKNEELLHITRED